MDKTETFQACDSHDYLIPPAKKNLQIPGIHREIASKNSNYLNTSISNHSAIIIKRTTEKLIREQYNILNLKDQYLLKTLPYFNKKINKIYEKEAKPVIKITVVPKVIETFPTFFNNRIFKRKITNSSSNHENCVQSNNVYEVKTSESEDFLIKRRSFIKLDNTPLKRTARNAFLRMNKNNFKDKRKKDGRSDSFKSHAKQNPCQTFNCPNRLENKKSDLSRHKSRVTIFGRLGLTDDDRYVLNCSATVNDKPIHTNLNQDLPLLNTKHNVQPPTLNERFKQDNECQSPSSRTYPRMESQSVQVNLQVSENTQNSKFTKNKHSQCLCLNADNGTTIYDSENENITQVRGCQSPIVVISVYPKQEKGDSNIGHFIKIDHHQEPSKTRRKEDRRPTVFTQPKFDTKSTDFERSRSISPKAKGLFLNNNNIQRVTDNYNFGNFTRNSSPTRSPNLTKKQYSQQAAYTDNDLTTKKGKVTCETKSKLSKKIFNNGSLDINRNLAKKTLVDNYINKLEAQVDNDINIKTTKKGFNTPQINASKLTINIDSETERYDLFFKNNRQNTDFALKKTVKTQKKMEHDMPGTKSSQSKVKGEKTTDKKSPLYVRDSIEISHKRASFGNPKLTKAQKYRKSSSSTNFNEFIAPAKHYRGDDCSIPDPTERDKEIRQLLGILTGRNLYKAKPDAKHLEDSFLVKNCEGCCCQRECKPIINQSSSLTKLLKKNVIKNNNKRKDKFNTLKRHISHEANLKTAESCVFIYKPDTTITKEINDERVKNTQCECSNGTESMLSEIKLDYRNSSDSFKHIKQIYKSLKDTKDPLNANENDANLIFNRNIHVFLEIERFQKQKPIVLTQKQYNKVRRTIQSAISKKRIDMRQRGCYSNKYSIVSIGEVKARSKFQHVFLKDKEVQTDKIHKKTELTSYSLSSMESFGGKHRSELLNQWWPTKEIEDSDKLFHFKADEPKISIKPRNVSSLQVRYASVALMKHVTYSSPTCSKGIDSLMSSSRAEQDSNSIHTIFKGRKKSVTPNLGTSEYSLCSQTTAQSTKSKGPELKDSKLKKPLLQRLVSCLIMRSRISETKIGKNSGRNETTRNSSVDSYHISTSFGGVEIPSSLYDTSASFYSNHTILPINRMKRSFFSSVRGFLSSRRN